MTHTELIDVIRGAFSELKDFQRETVNYTYKQLFENGTSKMLVADEVGLGKTIVAKGLIAKAFQHHLETEQKGEFHVVYICSNQALAAQNLKKLNLFKDPIKSIERLLFLAYEPEPANHGFRLSSLTPGTSFYLTGGSGKAEERLVLFRILTRYKFFKDHRNGLRYLLIGGVTNPDEWKLRTENALAQLGLRKTIYSDFKQALQAKALNLKNHRHIFEDLGIDRQEVSLWTLLKKYSKRLRKNNYQYFTMRNRVVGLLRQKLTEVCLKYLNADLIILDEFQRYRDLIHTEDQRDVSPVVKLARKVFEMPESRILMLSATPFKPYTNPLDLNAGEDHYSEFQMVLKFLLKDKDESFWRKLEDDRKTFFQLLRRPKETVSQLQDALDVKNRLEQTYLEAMVRTERIMVSDDRNTLLSNKMNTAFKIELADIKNFIQTDKIARGLSKVLPDKGIYNTIEYAKSAPFPLSFMDRYKLKELLHKHKRLKNIQKVLRDNADCWIDFKKINRYKPLMKEGLPNGKLRCLLENSLYSKGWQLLWVPPTISYYELSGAYADTDDFSKTIVFSSWVLVPRMIAALTSYEAERLTIGNRRSVGKQDKAHTYFQKGKEKRRPRPQLVFTAERKNKTAGNMTNFNLLYPSPTLAEIYHPRSNLIDRKSKAGIKNELRRTIKLLIDECGLKSYENETGESSRWYWAAPLLLDKNQPPARAIVEKWLGLKELPGDSNTDPEAMEDTKEEKSSARDHFSQFYEAFKAPETIGLGKMPADLEDVLVDIVLGSPAVCAYRSLNEYFNEPADVINGAAIISKGFMTLYNKPESIATVRLFAQPTRYWRQVLDYAVNGNLQSMLDEFVFLLYECEKYIESAQHLAQHFADVMNIRTSSIRVDGLKSFLYTDDNPTMRCHFALDFGNQRVETASGSNRIINLREAFNSPFKPFILASTSIGQEGLDFHYYCRKVMHWNLPNNAIDIEQREGRINRYMGHVIRKNITLKYLKDIKNPTNGLWNELFAIAKQSEQAGHNCDLVPYWHVECQDGFKIERLVPLHPFSKDIGRFRYLLSVLTFYRLTFGQPRQEELVEAIMKEAVDQNDIETLISNMLINLSPIAKKLDTRPL